MNKEHRTRGFGRVKDPSIGSVASDPSAPVPSTPARLPFIAFIASLPLLSAAQPFAIGSTTSTFFDASRNRDIGTNLYYPGVTAGNNAEVAAGAFPVLVIGHGFVMTPNAYANLWEHFVPLGYIVALPTTEGGFAPSHSDFGQDIAFVAESLQAANTDGGSTFFGHVAPTSALMGHSMGGGASFLGAAGNTAITTVVNFAAAETNPSAVAACAQVQVPALVFAGGNDCVTPIPDHQQPMYEALTVPCRAFVNILGGGHCYFAESNFNCNFGELTCSPSPSIQREEQHDVVNDLATLWLDHFLKGDQQALQLFIDSTSLSTRIAAVTTCALPTALEEAWEEAPRLWPTLVDDRFFVSVTSNALVEVFDLRGALMLATSVRGNGSFVDAHTLAEGTYAVRVTEEDGQWMKHIVVVR